MSCQAINPDFLELLAAELTEYVAYDSKSVDLRYKVAEQVKRFVGCQLGAYNAPNFDDAKAATVAKVRELYTLNAKAYCTLYPTCGLTGFFPAHVAIRDKWKDAPAWTVEQLLKHLQFVRYQLNVTPHDSSELFMAFSGMIGAIAEKYIECTSMAWQSAKWGD